MNFDFLKMNKGERTGLWVVVVLLVAMAAASLLLQRCESELPDEILQKAAEYAAADSVENDGEKEVEEIPSMRSPLDSELPKTGK